GVDPRRHGLDALAVSRQTEAGEVGVQRLAPIRMSEGTRQPVEILTEPPFASIGRVGSHAPILAWDPLEGLNVVDTVVLTNIANMKHESLERIAQNLRG